MADTKVASREELANALREVACTPASTLFAGAGVGKRAGLPDWHEYVEFLARVADEHDPDTGSLMRKRLESGLLLNALELYQICPVIPRGTKLEKLAEPFSNYQAKKLRALVALPFDSIVTTNFDRSLHDAFAMARQGAPLGAELGDPSLKQAMYNWEEPYVARIHGRVEVPKTMVLDQTGYARTEADPDYTDFLLHILLRTRCVFIGYSFIDPAIQRVLQVADERVAAQFPAEHLALLPESSGDLRERLARYNIKVLLYEEDNGHEALWLGVRKALDLYREGPKKPEPKYPEPLESTQRILAASYARATMASEAAPLRSVISEGLVIGLVAEASGITRLELAEKVRQVLPMNSAEASQTVHPAIDRLIKDGVIREEERRLYVLLQPDDTITPDLKLLAEGVLDRRKVRTGVSAIESDLPAICEILEQLVLARGWDLAAGLASAKRSERFEISLPLDRAFSKFGGSIAKERWKPTEEGIVDLLSRPNSKQSEILARLARLSFGVEVAIERGRSTLAHELTLPEIVYLDASVIMPAITPGHPYRPSYLAAIESLQTAAQRAGLASRIVVLDSFLNEIISHRTNAIQLVADGELEDRERLAKFMDYTGSDNTNVYVGGYSSHAGNSDEGPTFSEYLRDAAPYKTEEELAAFLAERGIETESKSPIDPAERELFGEVKSALDQAYAEDMSSRYEMKPDVLIRHEAQQLTRLLRNAEAGSRSIFVTADAKLRRLARGDVLGRTANALFSSIGLLHLVDLLVGLNVDDESLSRLLWAVEARDERDMLRGYFTDLALRRFDAAMAMAMPDLIDSVVDAALDAASSEGVRLGSIRKVDEIRSTFNLLDRFEEEFYERMREQIERQEE